MMGLSLTSKTHPYKEGFGPFLTDVYRIPFGVPANVRLSSRGPMTKGQVNELLDQTFRRVVAAESVAAIVVEPVLGEGGFVVPPAGFLPALVEICRDPNAEPSAVSTCATVTPRDAACLRSMSTFICGVFICRHSATPSRA